MLELLNQLFVTAAQAQTPAADTAQDPDIGSISWAVVGIGVIILFAAIAYGAWQYTRWKDQRSPAEAGREEEKTRELYRSEE
ncbi:hypothetical protein [Microbaculum marinum]|uniref:Uncharacterized protein n=1 Tax=Microbaculum marinum TaxID=1764581 RepID=A0AAW9S0X1_9HYPH